MSLEGCRGVNGDLLVRVCVCGVTDKRGGGRWPGSWLATRFPKAGICPPSAHPRLTGSSVNPTAHPKDPQLREVVSMTPGTAVPLESDPQRYSKTKFPEAATSGQPIFLNEWAPNILCGPRCKGPAETRSPAFALPAPRPGRRKLTGHAGGAGKPSKLCAAPARCSASLCPTGTSTAPRSARRHPSARRRRRVTPPSLPSQPELLDSEKSLTFCGFGFQKGGVPQQKSEQTPCGLNRMQSLPSPHLHLGSRSCS